ncbi:hypothetical protein ACWCQS_12540 [Streptomyces sp. NPDC002076]
MSAAHSLAAGHARPGPVVQGYAQGATRACVTIATHTGSWPSPCRSRRPPLRVPFTIDFSSTARFHNSDDKLPFGPADPGRQDGPARGHRTTTR